jgi:predicted flap endonuclease-1-like 5' DNA nuclease
MAGHWKTLGGCLCSSLILVALILFIWWLLTHREEEEAPAAAPAVSKPSVPPDEIGAMGAEASAVEEEVAFAAEVPATEAPVSGGEEPSAGWEAIRGEDEAPAEAEAAGGEGVSGGWEAIQGGEKPSGGWESLGAEESFAVKAEAPAKPDDLKRIEGIGPKIAKLLNEAGITTFAQLAQTDVETLRQILAKAGRRFALASPETWPEQAALAAQGDWEALAQLQDSLKGGRR